MKKLTKERKAELAEINREAQKRFRDKQKGIVVERKRRVKTDEWWEKLRIKHAGKPRLEKSINEVIILTEQREHYEGIR